MCGIAGFWGLPRSQAELLAQARAMGDAIVHRGPDAHGECALTDDGLALAHRRLSILDLSPAGAQPMTSHSGRWVVVYNGEIYNYRSIQRQLEAECGQIAWRGHSDTEILLAALEHWGVQKTLAALNGMFALAAWDKAEQRLILARDRLGEKPLYWGAMPDGTFLFGSELRALYAHSSWQGRVDRDALAAFMRYQCVPGPQSIFQQVHKLLPGHFLQINAVAGKLQVGEPQAYWRLAALVQTSAAARLKDATDHESYLNQFEDVLGQVVREQMLADVPLGAFLSGGIDSSLIVASMQRYAERPVKTYTVGFDVGEFDESVHARQIAKHLGCEHHEIHLTGQDALKVVPKIADIYDEPFADASQLPTYLVAQFARQHVTVALSGDGGDEMFAGYSRYFIAQRLWQKVGEIPTPLRRALGWGLRGVPDAVWRGALGVAKRVRPGLALKAPEDKAQRLSAMLASDGFVSFYDGLLAHWLHPEQIVQGGKSLALTEAVHAANQGQSVIERMQAHDTLAYLPNDILVKVDRAAMAVSLETRAPFLDPRIMDFAWHLPAAYKHRGDTGKCLMRDLLARYVPRTLFERPKQGFAIPLESWLRGPLQDWAEHLLSPQLLAQEGYLNAAPIRQCWQQFLAGRDGMHYRLWDVLMFQAWLERYRQFLH